ncbi:major facilitator superfamily domain-containing protein [Immersiella caudata]|uniref:Efflux pump dotC n=1 Tax=Immersiella caudata TaxID=314043 RepID=A0AA40CBH0_9PEZI|nr:major facilitator superfamily domain-containing protein [Immersiella caudata]
MGMGTWKPFALRTADSNDCSSTLSQVNATRPLPSSLDKPHPSPAQDTSKEDAIELEPIQAASSAPNSPTISHNEKPSPPSLSQVEVGGGELAPEEGRTRMETILVVGALASALFLAALDITIVTVAIPTITQEFHSTAGYTWIGSAYMLASAAMAPMWGKVSDIWGRKPIMLIAVGIFWVGSLLCAMSRNMGMLIASRAVQGLGGGGIIILVNICISDLFSMRKRGFYFGIMGIVWVAASVGPVVGGAFTSEVTWRWCFWVNLPISGIGMFLLAFVLKLHNPRTPMKQGLGAVDWLGSLTVVGATLMILLALEFGGVIHPWGSPMVVCLIVFGFIMAILFVVVEWKIAKYPIIPIRLFGVRSNLASIGTSALQGFVFISGSYYLPLYLQSVLGASPLESGLYILPYAASSSLVSALSGLLIKKTGKYLPPIISGMVFMTLGFGLFIDLEPTANWPKIILYQLIAGSGVGPNFQSPLIALQTMVEPRDMASATATYGFVRQLCTAVSIVIGGVVFQNRMQAQYPQLVSELGPEIANFLSGANAASSVGLVAQLPDAQRRIAQQAYFDSLRTMYIMYTAFSAVGLIVSCFIGSRKLSKDHQEHKTGLDSLRAARVGPRSTSQVQARRTLSADMERGNGGPSRPCGNDGNPGEKGKKGKFFNKPAFFFDYCCLSSLVAMASAVSAASLQQVNNFGANTSGARMYIYVPDQAARNPPIIVAIHYCTGTAQASYNDSPYARLADRHGFIVIYPESPYSGGCWDVSSPASSPATLTHNGGANSNPIANMVAYTISQDKAAASRVFVTGTSSSGAMITNVLAATYPNLFKAANAYAGVPAGCFHTDTTAGRNSTCANGQEIHPQDVWAQTALKIYPGYTGPPTQDSHHPRFGG